MNSKKALKSICDMCEIEKGKRQVACPFRSIDNEYCEEYEQLKQDLDRLEKLEKAIEILKGFKIDLIDYCNGHYSMEILYDTGGLTKEQYELLKEVLGND